jgi:hypothetical protein
MPDRARLGLSATTASHGWRRLLIPPVYGALQHRQLIAMLRPRVLTPRMAAVALSTGPSRRVGDDGLTGGAIAVNAEARHYGPARARAGNRVPPEKAQRDARPLGDADLGEGWCRMVAGAPQRTDRTHDAGQHAANGVRSLDVSCWLCHHRTVLSASRGRIMSRARHGRAWFAAGAGSSARTRGRLARDK